MINDTTLQQMLMIKSGKDAMADDTNITPIVYYSILHQLAMVHDENIATNIYYLILYSLVMMIDTNNITNI